MERRCESWEVYEAWVEVYEGLRAGFWDAVGRAAGWLEGVARWSRVLLARVDGLG